MRQGRTLRVRDEFPSRVGPVVTIGKRREPTLRREPPTVPRPIPVHRRRAHSEALVRKRKEPSGSELTA